MPGGARRPVVVLAVLVGALSGCGAAGGASADPCAVVPGPMIATTLSIPQAPHGKPTGTAHGCTFEAGPRRLTVEVLSDGSVSSYDDGRRIAVRSGAKVTDLRGVGDAAFVAESASAPVVSARARRGARRVGVVLQGPGASATLVEPLIRQAVRGG